MLNAGIPDIAIEPDKTLHKVKEKLKLGKCIAFQGKESVHWRLSTFLCSNHAQLNVFFII